MSPVTLLLESLLDRQLSFDFGMLWEIRDSVWRRHDRWKVAGKRVGLAYGKGCWPVRKYFRLAHAWWLDRFRFGLSERGLHGQIGVRRHSGQQVNGANLLRDER